MKRGLLYGVFCLFLSVSAGMAATILKLGHIADPQNPYAQGAQKLADLMKEKTGGAVEIQVFPSSQLGNQRDLIEGLTFGTLDMTLTSTAVFGNFVSEMGVFDLPFIFRDVEHAYKAMDQVCMEVGKLGEPRGIKTLGVMENGVRHMTNNRGPIRKPADMRGLKIRVMEQPVYIEMMKALDASPTPMAFGELYTALQKGVIDGQENPLAHIWTSRFFEVQKYISLSAHTYSGEPVLISLSSWGKLSPDQRTTLQASVDEAVAWQRNLCREMEGDYLKNINASGKSTVNDDVDKAAFAAATKGTWKIFADSVKGGQAIIDKIIAVK
ncbi:MAG: DctP family TRAP transporter solute-binding subunit [Planctomycetota bacterium]|jgi:tripartite ATP-independent transporter DctP family solute receptor|nr:DctP family TRAP transporter solute-binding subunit [Planctomycetota bacterium]